MSPWDAVAKAAKATRRLNRAISGRRLSDEDLEEIADAVESLAARFDSGAPRDKLEDMLTRPHLAAIYAGQYTPLELEVGDEIEFDPFSIAGRSSKSQKPAWSARERLILCSPVPRREFTAGFKPSLSMK